MPVLDFASTAAVAEDPASAKFENGCHPTAERFDEAPPHEIDALVVLVETSRARATSDGASAHARIEQLLADGKPLLSVRDARDLVFAAGDNALQ